MMKVRICALTVLAIAALRLCSGCSSGNHSSSGTGGAGTGGAGTGGAHGTGGTPGTGGGAVADAGPDGGGDGSQTDGRVTSDGPVDAPPATLTQIWTTILSVFTPMQTAPSCAGCHDGTPGIPDYSSPATTYATWVNVPSTSCAPGIRVTPGNAETSVLVNKLRAKPNLGLGVTVCGGDPMPLGTDRSITLDQLHLIESWINAGALNN
jgi:hypothetical protein